MKTINMNNILFGLILLIDIVISVKILGPESQVTVIGDSLSMSCGSDGNEYLSRWYFLGIEATKEVSISRIKITKPGIYAIEIENVTSADAGTYRCLVRKQEADGAKSVAEFKADLIVFESHPLCTYNRSMDSSEVVEGDAVTLSCSVVYFGKWIPSMKWSRTDGKPTSFEITTTQNNTRITSKMEIVLRPEDNEVTFVCQITFKPSPLKTNADRLPNYEFNWNYTLNVLYWVRRIEITPEAETYSPNDKLYCLAAGNPMPTCKWTDVQTQKILSQHCLLIIDSNIALYRQHTFQCTAENVIGKVSNSTSKRITFSVAEPPIFAKYSWIFAIVGTVIICVAIFFILKAIKKSNCNLGNREIKEKSRENSSSQHDYDSINETTPQPSTTVTDYVQGQDLETETAEPRSSSFEDMTTSVIEEPQDEDYSNLSFRPINQIVSCAYRTLTMAASATTSVSQVNPENEESNEMTENSQKYYNI